MTRGLRNNNPLNIRRVAGQRWKGQEPPSNSPLKGEDREFVRFSSMEWGLRTAFCILNTYRRKYKAVCVEDIINRWAPPSENDTRKYVETVCRLTGFGGKERLVESQLPALVHAMAFVECGAPISKETINKAHSLYVKLKSNSK